MNRTLIMLVAVLLLGGVAWLALSKNSAPARVALAENDRQFAYEEEADIARIYIADRRGHEVNLTRGGRTGWLVNGESPANDNVMKNLLDAVTRIDIRTLPARNSIPMLVNSLASEGILVRLFDESGNKLRGYYIGGGTEGEYGAGAIMEGSENPYVVHLPNFSGNIRFRFNKWDDEWRSKVVIQTDPDKVDLLEIKYPTEQGKSFRLTRAGDGDGYNLENPYNANVPPRKVSRGAAEGVLARYEKLYAADFENGDTESIAAARQVLPFASIRIQETGQEPQTLEVYPRFGEKAFTNDLKSGEIINLDGLQSYTAFANQGKDWVLLGPHLFQPLLVGYDAF